MRMLAKRRARLHWAHRPVQRAMDRAVSSLMAGNNALACGNFDRALKQYKRFLHYHSDRVEHWTVGSTLVNMGTIYLERGEYQTALDTYKRAGVSFSRGTDRDSIIRVLVDSGVCCYHLEESGPAIAFFERALEYQRQLYGGQEAVAETYYSLRLVHFNTGALLSAVECFKSSLQIRESLGASEQTDVTLAELHLRMGDALSMMDSVSYTEDGIKHYVRATKLMHFMPSDHEYVVATNDSLARAHAQLARLCSGK
jgi:tetratricopeptide (TPR) repeat protein